MEDLIEEARNIIAGGCGCNRHCETMGDCFKAYCGCLDDAERIVKLARAWKEPVAPVADHDADVGC